MKRKFKISERHRYLLNLQRALVISGFFLGLIIFIVAKREGFFSTNALIMYGIGIIYITISTHISISDVLTRDKNLLDKEELK